MQPSQGVAAPPHASADGDRAAPLRLDAGVVVGVGASIVFAGVILVAASTGFWWAAAAAVLGVVSAFALAWWMGRRAHARLQTAERRWRLALEGAGVGVWDWDIVDDTVFTSRRLNEMLGRDPRQAPVASAAWRELVHPADRDMVDATIPVLLKEGDTPLTREYRVCHADGSYRWVRSQGWVVQRGRDGHARRAVGTHIDVTEVKEQELAVARLAAEKHALAERLRLTFNSMPVACFVCDAQFRILNCNPAAERMFGWPVAELVGASSLERMVPPEEHEALRAVAARIAAGEPVLPRVHENVTREGGRIVCEWRNERILAADGAVAGVLAMATDVTERERGAAALRESEARYRSLIEMSPDGVALVRGGRVEYANESFARLLRAGQPAALVGRPLAGLFCAEDALAVGTEMDALAVATGQTIAAERRMVALDGDLVDVDVRATSYRARDAAYVQVMVRDITVRKRVHHHVLQINAELERRVKRRTAELEAANRELESFSYSVAHDLRAPLRAIDGYVRMLEEDHAAAEAGRGRYVERVRANVARMAGLIDDLLEYARIGRRSLELAEVDSAELVRGVLEEHAAAYPDASIRVEPLPAVRGDAVLLRQVWANLIGNALKFSRTRAAPAVEIGAAERHGEHVFFVRDNGVGFSMDYAHKLFGVFERLHGPSEFEGTGVGLAIVERAVQRHGGRAWAQAEPDAGATFYFALPAAAPGGVA